MICGDLLDDALVEALAYNDGAGPVDHETCAQMADRFEVALAKQPHGFASPANGLMVTTDGRFVTPEELTRNPNLKTRTPYFIDGDHVREWIGFLRSCGGFEVW
jgi:hypothetical protein